MQEKGLSRKEVDALLLLFKIEKVGTVKSASGKGAPSNLYDLLTINRAYLKVKEYERSEATEGTSIAYGD
jgi:hypothetical protein